MYSDADLTSHLQNSSVIENQSLVIAEWNLNNADNIKMIGNYRYRPTDNMLTYNTFDEVDLLNTYTGATDANVTINAGVTVDDVPITFKSTKELNNLLFSLEDCFYRFRPRSGINKFTYFPNRPIPNVDANMDLRPKYYAAGKDDKFKYWTSYRTENGIERGIANPDKYIDDAAPFIVYKDKIPTNRIIVKMQTNVGSIDESTTNFSDPFFGDANKTTPINWKIEKLTINNTWVPILDFGDMPTDIASDGYFELAYGLKVPDEYKSIFVNAGTFSSPTALPTQSINGYAYLVKQTQNDVGVFYIWLDEYNNYATFNASYGWFENSQTINNQTPLVKDLTSPISFFDPSEPDYAGYIEFQYIYGLRIVVKQMNKVGSTFDLIELSPRLTVDLSDKIVDYSIKKTASDLGVTGMPVGQLIASTGSINLFDYDQAFMENNTLSIIKNFSTKNLQFKFYELINNVKTNLGTFDYYVPIKTMYSEGFPVIAANTRNVQIQLRDLYFYFESTNAPELLITNQTLSYIVSTLLDSIGYSNYKFLRVPDEKDVVIPYFFVSPDTSVAQVLNNLAISTQTAMFFDEANDFVIMSKNYIMPTEEERATDLTFTDSKNIVSVSSSNNNIYNDGKIIYTTRYIQKTYGSIAQANVIDTDKTWVYKPVLLWEVSPNDDTKSINDETNTASSYSLSAVPLNSDLTDALPTVVNNAVINNIIDFGEGIYWLSRYAGYFYANGEIIKYDAVEYSISNIGNVWITNVTDYQNYFSKLSFNGKMFPTGRVRIYTEPQYNLDGTMKNGSVLKHGRSQFGTPATYHNAGLSSYWSDVANRRVCKMNFNQLISGGSTSYIQGAAGINIDKISSSTVNGIIKNFFSASSITEATTNTLKSTKNNVGSVQSSALVFNGPNFETNETATNFVSYVYKPLNNRFVHFGTRLRIIGQIDNATNMTQTGLGSSAYFNTVGGASGGIAVLLNPDTNNGYYFEIAALTDNNVNSYTGSTPINNMYFYKVARNADAPDTATPVTLWSGLAPILVDDGRFTGQSRMYAEKNPTVYDLSVEYEDKAGIRTFYLYVNQKIVAVVHDDKPLEHINDNNVALFVRGSARLMFENVYALTSNYSQNTSSLIDAPVSNVVFNDQPISSTDSFKKYSLSGAISSTYLSGLSSSTTPDYNIYFEEFGTIMREMAYFNIRYDKAYPALFAKVSPTFNNLKGYTISGFTSTPYGAEFLVFNNTDTILNLDETSGNYLRIQGVTFTQQSQHQLSVDEYFSKTSDFSGLKFDGNALSQAKKDYQDIRNSRITYGKKDFTLDTQYIQTQDAANDLMSWTIKKVMKPRKSVGIDLFAMPTIQLGDIVKVNYIAEEVNQISNSRFVVYSIDYSKKETGPSLTAD